MDDDQAEDWQMACSDDEKYNPTGEDDPDIWQPEPQYIISLYEKLAKGERLKLEWRCPGRRSPTPERMMDEVEEKEEEDIREEEDKQEPTEFDFDELLSETKSATTPIRTPGGSKTPRTVQKRVARLDKILDDISRHKKLNRVKVKGSSQKFSSPSTPTSGQCVDRQSQMDQNKLNVSSQNRPSDVTISSAKPFTPKSPPESPRITKINEDFSKVFESKNPDE